MLDNPPLEDRAGQSSNFFRRSLAALLAISTRRSDVMLLAGLLPPLRPSSCAALYLVVRAEIPRLFARGDPHNFDGGTNDIGGAALAFGASRHYSIPSNFSGRSCTEM
jgi:hypothetical protein